jgi:ribosome-associated protein
MQNMDDTSSPGPSRSQRKREVLALQKIGEVLVKLPASQLAKIPLEPILADAINEARTLKSREALRRQLQYIGRLMRNVDPLPIQEALDKVLSQDQHSKAELHQIERWRDKLISIGDKALEEFFEKCPHADRQYLRQLIRRAQQDRNQNKNTGSQTELFRYIRELFSE